MKLNENKEFYIEKKKKNPKLYRSIDYQKIIRYISFS